MYKLKCNAFDFSTKINNPDEVKQEGEKAFSQFANTLFDLDQLIVLAGSGTSLTFNDTDNSIAPSMWDLWQACKTFAKFQEVLDLVGYSQKANSDFYEDPDGDDENGQPIIRRTSLPEDNIELLLSLVDHHLEFGVLKDEESTLLKTFRTHAIQTVFDKTNFVATDAHLKKTDEKWYAHRSFIHKLARRSNKQTRLKVFTTNYDTAFEKAASDVGFVVIDGFEFNQPYRFNPTWFHYDIVRRTENRNQNGAYLTNVLHLYKLHGSVDWRYANGEVIKASAENINGEKVIIYPSSSKYKASYSTPYLDMISAFTHALQQPKTGVICLGFGFNDEHLNNAITMALRTNSDLHLLVATRSLFPNEGTSSSFNATSKKLLESLIAAGDPRIAMADMTFADFVSRLPARQTQTPQDKLQEALRQAFAQTHVAGAENE